MSTSRGQDEVCARAREWSSLRLDSQLSEFEVVLLEAHLALCLTCRAFAESLTGVTDVLRSAPLERVRFPFQVARRRNHRLHAVRAAAAVATVATVALSGTVNLQLSTGGGSTTAIRLDREAMRLKASQLEALDGFSPSAVAAISPGVAAAEQVTLAPVAVRQPSSIEASVNFHHG